MSQNPQFATRSGGVLPSEADALAPRSMSRSGGDAALPHDDLSPPEGGFDDNISLGLLTAGSNLRDDKGVRVRLRTGLVGVCAGATALFVGGAQATVTTGAAQTTRSTSSRSVTHGSTAPTLLSKREKLPAPLGWVRNLQRDLRKLHFYAGPITGVYTPATRAAVIRFQKAAHLVPDGLWGPKSQAALDKMLHRRK